MVPRKAAATLGNCVNIAAHILAANRKANRSNPDLRDHTTGFIDMVRESSLAPDVLPTI